MWSRGVRVNHGGLLHASQTGLTTHPVFRQCSNTFQTMTLALDRGPRHDTDRYWQCSSPPRQHVHTALHHRLQQHHRPQHLPQPVPADSPAVWLQAPLFHLWWPRLRQALWRLQVSANHVLPIMLIQLLLPLFLLLLFIYYCYSHNFYYTLICYL